MELNEEAAPIINEPLYESSAPEEDEGTLEESQTPPTEQRPAPATQSVSTILHDFNISPESPETSLENSEMSSVKSDEQATFEQGDASPEETTTTFDPVESMSSKITGPVDETEIEASEDGVNSAKEEDSIDEEIEDDEPKKTVERVSEEEETSSSGHGTEAKNPIELMSEEEENTQSKETVEMLSEEETLEAKETMDLMSEEEDIL